MPLSAQQICSLARQDARCPNFLTQSGQLLNMILSDLCQTYDFAVAKKTYKFNFNPSQVNSDLQAYQNLPNDYLRAIRNECFYYISGVPYPMIPCDQEEFDMLVQQAGLSNFPVFFTTDMSRSGAVAPAPPFNDPFTQFPVFPQGAPVPVMLFWMTPSGAYPMTVRYHSQMPDIEVPETSVITPWFPNQTYLRRRLAGELMALTDDERQAQFLGDDEDRTPQGAGVMLRKYLMLQGDKSNRVQTVTLDRRRFGTSFDKLRNTKQIGW